VQSSGYGGTVRKRNEQEGEAPRLPRDPAGRSQWQAPVSFLSLRGVRRAADDEAISDTPLETEPHTPFVED